MLRRKVVGTDHVETRLVQDRRVRVVLPDTLPTFGDSVVGRHLRLPPLEDVRHRHLPLVLTLPRLTRPAERYTPSGRQPTERLRCHDLAGEPVERVADGHQLEELLFGVQAL